MLQIKIQKSGDYLRVDNFANNPKRLMEKILPEKVLQRQTKAIAELIGESITENLLKGRKYTGGSVAKLKRSTIKRKGHSRVFLDKGKLFNSVIVKKIGTSYMVQLKEDRADVGKYLQEGNRNMKARPFFGITKAKLSKIVKEVFNNRNLKSTRAA